MSITDNYSFGTNSETLDIMTDAEAKDYFESSQADEYLASAEFHDSKLIQ